MTRIIASHGSGGRLTQKLIKIFLKYFNTPELQQLDDGAIFRVEPGEYALSTDSFVVTPLFFPGGDIGKLAVTGTINDLASMGAEPLYMSVGFILQEGLEMTILERILESMAETARQTGIKIITGDTKVIEAARDTEPGVFINTTGIGRCCKPVSGLKTIAPGDKIIINGGIGEHGFCILSQRLKMGDGVKSDCEPLAGLVKQVMDHVPVKFMRDPSRGGLSAVLNEVIEANDFGIKLLEENIPISPEVFGLSELLGISPLEVASEGRMLFFVSPSDAEPALNIMRSHSHGKDSVIIGEVIENPAGKVIMENPYGTQRLLIMPLAENLPRIC